MSTTDPADWSQVLGSMTNERTTMAWERTALAWGAAGAVVVRYHAPDGWWSAATAVGMAMLLCGVLLALAGVLRYRARDRALRNGHREVPEPLRLIRLVSCALVVTVAAAVVVELAGL